jgi:hypothetical protein
LKNLVFDIEKGHISLFSELKTPNSQLLFSYLYWYEKRLTSHFHSDLCICFERANCNDCNSVNHDLFTELDAGNVIVLCWVMPCASCIGGASTDATSVQSFAASYPGRVKYYMSDDSGNTPCNSLTLWASTNGIHPDACFSNSSINMADYGGPGMPKTVVLGGTSHTVFYNVNGPVNSTALEAAINNALAATGIADQAITLSGINLFPNPVNNNTTVLSYDLIQNADVTVDVYDIFGAKVKSISAGNQIPGKHELTLDLSTVSNGVYFISLGAGEASLTTKFIIAQ